MYLKRLLAFLCCFTLVFCLFPSSAFASGGNGNIDGGGGSMGQGTSSNFWNSGNDGVRITVVDASSGTAVSSPLDFSNRTQKTSLLHFGKVNKLQYLGGTGLSLQSGVAYSCIRPTQSMPTIVSSKGQSNIEAIKRYFCSEYACMMVAQAAGVDYERMIAGEYKLLIEPIFQDIDRDCRQCEFEALSPEEQLAELKRAEESRQAWRQYIASLKEMINSSAAQE